MKLLYWLRRCSIAFSLLFLCFNSFSATLVVDDLSDPIPSTGNLTLRQAITGAGPGDTIIFELPTSPAIIVLTAGELDISQDLVIDGPGARHLTIDGGFVSRIFNISGPSVTIRGLTMFQGSDPVGAGVFIALGSTTNIEGCSITGCNASAAGDGGGIYNMGNLTVAYSEISLNDAGSGGGIRLEQGTAQFYNTTISTNRAITSNGGGVYANGGLGSFDHCTFHNNDAAGNGGGIYDNNGTQVSVYHTIIGGNSAIGGGPDLFTLSNIAGNFSLLQDLSSGGLSGVNNLFGINPTLGVLRFNGAHTRTHALSPGSICIDVGDPSIISPPPHDQRNAPRILDGDESGGGSGSRIDIGAFEFSPFCVTNTGGNVGAFGSLPYILNEVNNISFADPPYYVCFDIPGPGPHNIQPTNQLQPNYWGQIIIDGYTQEFAYPAGGTQPGVIEVEVDGFQLSNVAGLEFNAGSESSLVRGLSIINFINGTTDRAITINTDDITIQGNYIGINAQGTIPFANLAGVVIEDGDFSLIGGGGDELRNTISNNSSAQIVLNTNAGFGNVIAGNFIGPDPTGLGGMAGGGTSTGIHVLGGSQTRIGGVMFYESNTIGSNQKGILYDVLGNYTDSIIGNFIGMDKHGNTPIANNDVGIQISNGASGIQIGSSTDFHANVISNNGVNGIELTDANTTDNVIHGNLIGLDVAGLNSFPNTIGIIIKNGASTNMIGGINSNQGNFIGGNGNLGISITGANTSGNRVYANVIGLGTDNSPQSNGDGIRLENNCVGNEIGNTAGTGGNIISGNNRGVYALNAGAGNGVYGNWIGLDLSGTGAVGNSSDGIFAPTNVLNIGTATAPNYISGNGDDAIELAGNSNNVIGNVIGFATDNATALGNGGTGVNITGADNNVGGGANTNGNIIANCGQDGVATNSPSAGNQIRFNSIFDNNGLGIDLDNDNVVTANGSATTNDGMPFPVLNDPSICSTVTKISGTLENVVFGETYIIDFYLIPSGNGDGSGHGEGDAYLATHTHVAAITGNEVFSYDYPGALTSGDHISATTTHGTLSSTSEFSGWQTINPGMTLSPSATDESCVGACDGTLTVTVSGGTSPFTYVWTDSGASVVGTSDSVAGLCPDDYTVTVTDNNGCVQSSSTVTVASPPVLNSPSVTNTTNPTCNGGCDGTFDVAGSGGTSPYLFSINGGITWLSSTTFSGLCAGTYNVLVQDASGCTAGPTIATIGTTPAEIALWTSPGTICEAAGPTTFVPDAGSTLGGTWTASCGSCITSGGVFNPTGLSGSYAVTYTTPCGINDVQVVIVEPDVDPLWTTPGTICESAGTINLDPFITGTTGGSWIGGPEIVGNTFDPVIAGAGVYSVTYVVGSNPCQESHSEDITVIGDVDPAWTNPGTICSTGGDLTLTSLITGTTGGNWSGPGVSGVTFDPVAAGPGTHSITYSVGTSPCDESLSQNIMVEPDVDPTWTSPGTICTTGGSIDLSVAGSPVDAVGTWSGPGVTGVTFDPVSAGPGTHNITYIVGNPPCTESLSQDIIVEPDVDPSWTDPSPICETAGSINLDLLITGTTGGSWSGTGVTGNSFNPASGTQNVTYTVGNAPCAETSMISIVVEPDVDPSWTDPSPICATSSPINLDALITGTTGGSWSGTGVTGNMFDPTSGTQNVTYTVGNAPCAETSLITIVVEPDVDPAWTDPSPICETVGSINLDLLITGTTGGSWSGTGVTGNSFNPASGTQNVTYTVGNAPCAETSMISIVVEPDVDPSWTSPGTICLTAGTIDLSIVGAPSDASGTWSGTGVSGVTFDPAAAGAGTHSITYTLGNAPCQETDFQDIIVEPDVDPAWTDPSPICANAGTINLDALITGTTGGSWSGIGVTANTFNPNGGTQNVTYTVGNAPCAETSMITIVVEPDVDPAWTDPSPICAASGVINLDVLITGTTGGSWSGVGVTGNMFDPSSGTQTVTYLVGNAPCVEQLGISINVIPDVDPLWTNPSPICASAGMINLDLLITGTTGGSWSGTGVTGNMFDPSVGTQTITYAVGTAPCQESAIQSITVEPDVDPSWTTPVTICAGAGAIDLAIVGAPSNPAGTWSGTAVSGSTFDPAVAGPGSHAVSYTVGNAPCDETDVQFIEVLPDVDPTWTNPSPVCEATGAINLDLLITGTTGGSWSGIGVTGNSFDPTSGTQNITYSIGSAPCTETLMLTVTVEPDVDPSWTAPDTVCTTAGQFNIMLVGAPVDVAGTFSGTGISGVMFDPALAGPGTHLITYTVGTSPCEETDIQSIEVLPDVDPTWSVPNSVCEADGLVNLDALITGTTGGSWSGTGVAGNMFDPNSLSGVVAITYTVGIGICAEQQASNVTVDPLEDAAFDYAFSTYCSTDTDPLANIIGNTGGTFSEATSNITFLNVNTGLIDLSATTVAGTYAILYVTGGPCPDSVTFDITIQFPADATITPPTGAPYCSNATAFNLTAASAGGTWTGSGITDGNLGTFDPSVAGQGTHTITYTITGTCGDVDSVDIDVISAPDATILSTGPYCELDSLDVLAAATGGGTWSGPGIVDPAAGTFLPFLAGTGFHTIYYSVTAAGCTSIDSVDLEVVAAPVVTLSGLGAQYCTSDAPVTLTGTPSGGLFWSTIVNNFVTNPYDPAFVGSFGTGVDSVAYLYTDFTTGCSNLAFQLTNILTSPPAPIVNPSSYQFCQGDVLGPITATGGGGNLTWYSNPGLTDTVGTGSSLTIAQLAGGVHNIYVTETIGSCVSPPTIVQVTIFGQAVISAGNNITICLGDSVQLNASGGSSYTWTTSDPTISNPNIADPWVMPTSSTPYYVLVTTINNCMFTDSVMVFVETGSDCGFSVTNAFSPDGDGVNDNWIIDGAYRHPVNNVAIFNRWGDLLVKFENYDNQIVVWDGTNGSGDQLPSGTYYYVIEYPEINRQFSGWIQLMK
jgi:gliding motility-associated-like protein